MTYAGRRRIGFGGGVSNLYEYCLNDPVNLVDPDGLQWIAPFLVSNSSIIAGNSTQFIRPFVKQSMRLGKSVQRAIPKETPPRPIQFEQQFTKPIKLNPKITALDLLRILHTAELILPLPAVVIKTSETNVNIPPDNLIFNNIADFYYDPETSEIWRKSDSCNLQKTGEIYQ